MKKLNSISPFIVLLAPVIMIIGLLTFNLDSAIPAERQNASLKLQVPCFKVMVNSIF
ncbi:hypothetical protein GZH53_18920 [Flavihumibacter sp. R14]|nr:hypothetical protein [Flavihumibacter soli]